MKQFLEKVRAIQPLQLEEHYFITLRIDDDAGLRPPPTVIKLKNSLPSKEKKSAPEAY
jgi:hypothetical protein